MRTLTAAFSQNQKSKSYSSRDRKLNYLAGPSLEPITELTVTPEGVIHALQELDGGYRSLLWTPGKSVTKKRLDAGSPLYPLERKLVGGEAEMIELSRTGKKTTLGNLSLVKGDRVVCYGKMPDAALIAFGTAKGYFGVFDFGNGEMTFKKKAHRKGETTSITSHVDRPGTMLSFGGDQGVQSLTACLWDVAERKLLFEVPLALPAHVNETVDTGTRLFSSLRNNARVSACVEKDLLAFIYGEGLFIHTLSEGKLRGWVGLKPDVRAATANAFVALTRDGAQAVCGLGRSVSVMELKTLKLIGQAKLHTHVISALALASDGQLVTGDEGGVLARWSGVDPA